MKWDADDLGALGARRTARWDKDRAATVFVDHLEHRDSSGASGGQQPPSFPPGVDFDICPPVQEALLVFCNKLWQLRLLLDAVSRFTVFGDPGYIHDFLPLFYGLGCAHAEDLKGDAPSTHFSQNGW